MCLICANLARSLDAEALFSDARDISRNPIVGAPGGPLAFLNGDERGGAGPNGKDSKTIAEAGAHITRDDVSWSLVAGDALGDAAVVTYGFRAGEPADMPDDTTGFSRFSASQIAAAELMLLAWSDVARVTFSRVGTGDSGDDAFTDSAQLLFGNYDDGAEGAAAFAYFPSGSERGGDLWFNANEFYNADPTFLEYGYLVLLHEIGHAIGLNHPGDYNAGPDQDFTYADLAEYYEDSLQYSAMSYFDETSTGADHGGFYPANPMLDDIAAAQRLYGANTTTRTGDTVYGFNSTADRIWFSAEDDGGDPQAVICAVWDAGGDDTFDFSGYTHGGTIDLGQGNFSSVGGLVGNVAIASGAVIENAIGGSGAETILGNDSDNVLTGGGGADVLTGGGGADRFVYGAASDSSTAAFDKIMDFVSGEDAVDVTGAGTGRLLLSRFDGSTFLYFDANDDGSYGTEGVIRVYSSVAGTDILGMTDGVTYFGDGTDEALTGSDLDDTLAGWGGDDDLSGGAGFDWLYGVDADDILDGGAGSDALVGGSGADRFVVSDAAHSTTAAWDTILDFEVGVDRLDLRGVASSALISSFAGASFVYFDTDSNGSYDGVVIAAGATLSQDDILVTGEAPAPLSLKDAPLVLPGPPDEEPQILPAGLESKPLIDDAPIICPPGMGGFDAVGPSDVAAAPFDRPAHRIAIETPWDWILAG